MTLILFVVACALAVGWAGLRLWLDTRGRAARLSEAHHALEAEVARRTLELRSALDAADERAAELAAVTREKSDFLAGLSRELRTPLNAVVGFSDLLQMNAEAEPLTHRQSQAVGQIRRAGQELLHFVDTVTDLARLEAGDLPFSLERVDPRLVARQVREALAAQAESRGVSLSGPSTTTGPGVLADRVRLRQTLMNLVTNAIQYNRPGGSVTLEITETTESIGLCVRDTGVGIPRSRLATLFQPFRTSSRRGGPGIGLAVAQRLAEGMGGRIEVSSEPGVGSSFTLWLPVARAGAGRMTASPPGGRPLPAATLLYVEDNPSNVALMRQVVTALGPLQLHVAETGHEGLALARDLRPDAILLDINLPGLTGFELKARLDADPLTRGVPVLAISASATPADIRRGREAGFLAYLPKPLDVSALAVALSDALGPLQDDEAA